MSSLPKKTDLPEFVDIELSNTIDMHIASTDMLTVVDDYINEMVLNNMWNHTKHTGDPVMRQAEFLRDLNNSLLDLTQDTTGAKTSHETDYLSKLDTMLSTHQVWVYEDDSIVKRKENGNTEYKAFNIVSRNVEWIVYNEDTSKIVRKRLDKLKDGYGLGNVDENFLASWLEKFQRAHHKVKEVFSTLVSDDKDNHFRAFSDSIGLVTRLQESIDDRMIPFNDDSFTLNKISIGNESIEALPSVIPPVLDDKLDNGTKFLLKDLSQKVGHMFRRNMVVFKKKGFGNAVNPASSHGENLVTDFAYYSQFSNTLVTDLNGSISNTLGKLYRVLNFIRFQNSRNDQKTTNDIFNLVIENNIQRVDKLKNRIETITKSSTNDSVLKSISVDLPDQG